MSMRLSMSQGHITSITPKCELSTRMLFPAAAFFRDRDYFRGFVAAESTKLFAHGLNAATIVISATSRRDGLHFTKLIATKGSQFLADHTQTPISVITTTGP